MFKKLISLVKENKKKFIIGLLIGVVLVVVADVWYCKVNEPQEVAYSEFLEDLDNGKIDTIYYSNSEEMMRYTLYNSETIDMTKTELEDYTYPSEDWRMTVYPAQEDFRKEMLEKGVNIVIKSFQPASISILLNLGYTLLPIILFITLFKQMSMGFGKLNEEDLLQNSNVTFKDVIGHDEVIDDLKFIVELLKDPNKGDNLNAKIPRGILFSGPPGTGKTLLAKAIAGESNVPFIYMNASNFIEQYVGTGAKRVRELFDLAKRSSPCIIFIDEIDAIGTKRGASRGTSENDQTINALLQELDGFKDKGNIFVIAATNRPDSLDKALTRAGRFDRQVAINPPKNWKVRRQLFDFYLQDCKVDSEVNTETLSKQLVGYTGADISSVVNEAKIIGTMRDAEFLIMKDLEEAVDKIIFKGNKSKSEAYKKDKEIVAYHEAGHAVVTYLLNEPIARASIAGTTSGVGGVVFREEKDSQFRTNKDLENNICISYAGRCAERIKFEIVTTGASSDITSATDTILNYIEKYGFNQKFGMLDMEILHQQNLIDNSYIVSLMSEMAVEFEEKTMKLLKDNFKLVEILAVKLLECETLSGDGILELFSQVDQSSLGSDC